DRAQGPGGRAAAGQRRPADARDLGHGAYTCGRTRGAGSVGHGFSMGLGREHRQRQCPAVADESSALALCVRRRLRSPHRIGERCSLKGVVIMSKAVMVIGDGPVGRTVARQSIARGDAVRVVTRSGTGPQGAERRAVDAADPAALRAAMTGVQTVFDCLHPRRYTARAWRRELPAADRAVRAEARRTGGTVVYPESLYACGPQTGPVDAAMPRRPTTALGRIRADLIDARLGSGQPVAIVVAADFYGPYVRDAHAGERMVRAVTGGQALRVIGDPDAPHSFTYVPDLAAAMIAAADRGG